MKVRTIRYMIKEGIVNTYKNKLMSLASISIVLASLLVFGMFFMLIENLRHNAKVMNEQQEMKVFCNYELEEEKVKEIEKAINSHENVKEYEMITAREAFEIYKAELGENAQLVANPGCYPTCSITFELTLVIFPT
jgi:cell division transport system permease protein